MGGGRRGSAARSTRRRRCARSFLSAVIRSLVCSIEVPGIQMSGQRRCLSTRGNRNVTELVQDDRSGQDSEELRKRLLYEAGVAVLADIHGHRTGRRPAHPLQLRHPERKHRARRRAHCRLGEAQPRSSAQRSRRRTTTGPWRTSLVAGEPADR